MAGFYWYERNPQLFNDEKQAMNLYFPNFVLDRLAVIEWDFSMTTSRFVCV